MAPFTFCPVCRSNHDRGKGHKYGAKHKQHLREFLSKTRSKVQNIRSSLKEVTLSEGDGGGGGKFWCAFCEEEMDEKASSYNLESAIQHLGGESHFRNVKKFCSEQGADVADIRCYLISKEEVTKWQERCRVVAAKVNSASDVETNNIHSGCGPESSLALGTRQIVSHVASIDDVRPLAVLTLASPREPVVVYGGASSLAAANGGHQSFSMSADFGVEASSSNSSRRYYPSPSNEILRGVDTVYYTQAPGARLLATQRVPNAQHILPSLPAAALSQYTVMATGQDLSKVVCPPLLPGEGNVHSGATPPWIGPSVDEKLFVASSTEIGPCMEPVKKPSLSKNQERKLAKLRPANRVGAAWAEMRRAQLEREARGEMLEGVPQADATWLPNFGRVWQSGSRQDTRKEFEAEKRRDAKRLGRPLGKRGAPSLESPVQIQPYVSKRQRAVETGE